MPNARVQNLVPNARDINAIPNARVSSFQSGRIGEIIVAGTPIGLLLALTYATKFVPPRAHGEFRPSARVMNI